MWRLTERWVEAALSRPRRCLALVLAVTLLLGLGVTRLELRTDGATLYAEGEPAVERTRADRRGFSEPDQLIVLLTARDGSSIATPEGLGLLKQVHESLHATPGVAGNRLRSLATLFDPRPGISLVMMPRFLDAIPAGVEEFDLFLRRIQSHPLAPGLFLSADGRVAAFYAPVARGHDREPVLDAIQARLVSLRTAAFDLRVAGPVAAEVALGRAVLDDLKWLTPIIVGVLAVMFVLCLRSVGATLVALAQIPVVLLWVFGAMGWAGVPITLVTTILPVILLTIVVADEIHLLDRFRSRLAAGAVSVREALAGSFRDVGRPVVLMSLTTGLGFLSFLTASIPPLRWFGLFTALGVFAALVLSCTFVPALILALPSAWVAPRPAAPSAGAGFAARVDRFAYFLGDRGALIGGALVLAALPGLAHLTVQDSWIGNLDPRSDLVAAHVAYDEAFWGAYRFDVVLTGSPPAYFQRVEGIRLVEEVVAVARTAPRVSGVLSHVAAHEVLADVYGDAVPASALPPDVVLQRSDLLEKIQTRIDLDHYLRRDGRAARIRLFVKDAGYGDARTIERHLATSLPGILQGTGLGYHVSGDLPASEAVVRSLVGNMMRSLGWSVAGVGLVLTVALGSLRLAAIALTPLVAAIPALLGGMGYFGMPLGIATSMFAGVTIGVGVDFGLHVLHAYGRSRATGVTHAAAVEESARTAGRAILWNVLVLVAGLSVLCLSSLGPNRNLGVLLVVAMPACYVATLLFLPLLLRTTNAGAFTPAPVRGGLVLPNDAARRI